MKGVIIVNMVVMIKFDCVCCFVFVVCFRGNWSLFVAGETGGWGGGGNDKFDNYYDNGGGDNEDVAIKPQRNRRCNKTKPTTTKGE